MTKIYLVDDDEDDRMLARQALESVIEGIDIIEFSDGNQLLDLIEDGLDDLSLVLMDINMPRITALEVLSEIKGRLDQRHIPVVIFSTTESA
jgi:CheY-like chemotaxis protein